jgi:tetratricopeptide (TPR) repeat protein
MPEPDPTMTEIGRGIGLGRQGEPDAARALFTELWARMAAADGDPLHRCALAHSMADVEEDVREELVWDLRALDAAELITDACVARAGVSGSVAAFYPSLHLNLGECYRKLGEYDQAREHLRRGLEATVALEDDGYSRMLTDGLDRLAQRLAAGCPSTLQCRVNLPVGPLSLPHRR